MPQAPQVIDFGFLRSATGRPADPAPVKVADPAMWARLELGLPLASPPVVMI